MLKVDRRMGAFHSVNCALPPVTPWNGVWNFTAKIPRHNNELSVWNYWSQSDEGFVSRYGSLHGLKQYQSPAPIYLMPYVAGQSHVSDDLINSVHPDSYDLLYNLGGDIRYSSPTGLTLNATINPDFGQVEADPAAILT
jgi:hypothetical protein